MMFCITVAQRLTNVPAFLLEGQLLTLLNCIWFYRSNGKCNWLIVLPDWLLWLCTCLAGFGIVSRSQEFKSQADDTTSIECFAWSNSVWKPTETGRWGLPSMEKERSSGMFSTSTMLKIKDSFSVWSFKEEHHQHNNPAAQSLYT